MNSFSRLTRLPPYVFTVMGQLKEELIAKKIEVYDFGLGNPDQPTPTHIIDALNEAVKNPLLHRYVAAKGILPLRQAIANWYGNRFNVDVNPDSEVLVTVGSKEGLAHLALAVLDEKSTALVPNPCYPVHYYGCLIAGATVHSLELTDLNQFLHSIEKAVKTVSPKPTVLILNFPSNPTTQIVDLAFFERIVALAKEHQFWVVHDFAYADIVFEGYKAPSILEVPGAFEVAIESYTLSKSYNMAGWRIGFLCGNKTLVQATAKIKSYIDYGTFAPIQMAAVAALESPENTVADIRRQYEYRRNVMCRGLETAGFKVNIPKATMFLWLKIPDAYVEMGSFEFAKLLLREAHVVVSPGIGFGSAGEHYVRLSLVENNDRMELALKNIQRVMQTRVHYEESVPGVISSA